MNFIHIAGHLGADPEVRFTSSGQKVTTFRVACRARGKANEDNTIWWRVTVWGDQFDKMVPYFKKGSSIMVMGELNKPEIFVDREGKSQISMSITANHLAFSPFGRASSEIPAAKAGEPQMAEEFSSGLASGQQESGSAESDGFVDEELPF